MAFRIFSKEKRTMAVVAEPMIDPKRDSKQLMKYLFKPIYNRL